MNAPLPLNPQQRAHLLRSTKKLEAVLGTTPVVEGNVFEPVDSHSIFKFKPKARQPQPLILGLPSDTKRLPRSPLSPSFANSPVDLRRRKMAKLVRTLGENVPPELVFPNTTSKQQRRRSWSVDTSPSAKPSKPSLDLAPFNNVVRIERTPTIDSDATLYESASAKSSFDSIRSNGRRKEREWSGEWNQEMDAVIDRLRALRTK